jgi:hypothetical protein
MTWFHYALAAGNSTLLSAGCGTDGKNAGEKFILSSIYNHCAGTHDAITFGETKNAGVLLNKRNKNYGN